MTSGQIDSYRIAMIIHDYFHIWYRFLFVVAIRTHLILLFQGRGRCM